MSDTLVKFKNVEKAYGAFKAVRKINLEIDRGEFVAIMGPSGCGKTTTLRMLAGLEKPTSGEIFIEDRMMNNVPVYERDTPLVWQSLALFPFLTARENVEFGLKMRGINASQRKERAMTWLDKLGLKGFENRQIDQLSGGQKQRVALARSLVTEPKMLLLDEPLSALDAHLVIRMQGVLTKLQKELGITFVYVTHSQSEAFSMADRVVIMGNGEIEQIGKPNEIFRAPGSRFVAEFVGRNNIFPSENLGKEIVVAADRMSVGVNKLDDRSIMAEFLAEEFAGTSIICYFESEGGQELKAQVTEKELAELSPEPGKKFWLSWSHDAEHLISR